MANYAYLRVSTDSQDVNNQKHGILEYSNRLGLSNLVFVGLCVWSKEVASAALKELIRWDDE